MTNLQSYLQSFGSIIGAETIELSTVYQLQNHAPNLMVYTMPAIILFTMIEFIGSYFSEHKTYENKETQGSLLVGLGNLLVNLLMKTVLLTGAIWIYNLLPWRMELNWWTLIFCFVAYDFCSYWSHRISHYNRFFWVTHVVHHSADHYNLTVAFRQSWVQHFKIMFFIPVSLMGFHPVIFFVANQLSTLYQFWVHTEAIGKLHPFIEKYFGTPSNHRVHHGSQQKYLDKNFGATFMIWDHIFGSFQYEEEKPIYGLTSPIENKSNPFMLNFHEYKDMLKDVKHSSRIREALFFIFGSPAKIHQHKINKVERNSLKSRKINTITTNVVVVLLLVLASYSVIAQEIKTKQLPTPKGKDLLFFLQRTPDANTVIYEMNYKSDGSVDCESPVKGSWIRYAENGKAKELTPLEKKFGYGVKCKSLGKDAFEIRLAAYQKMALYLLKSEEDQKYRVYIKEGGKNLLLKRVFVKVNGGSFWFPKVIYIDLFTTNTEDGMEILKRIDLG